MLALPLAALLSLVPSIAALSPKFEGVWEGTPDETTLGPFLRSFDLHIAAVPYGHLISDTLNATEYMIPGSQQQFWVNETTLTYCGIIRHFFPEAARVVTTLEVQADRTNETHYVWCAPVRIGGCHLLQWTLALDETTDTLQSQVLLAEPVVHMHSFFKRTTRKLPTDVQYTPLPPPCTLKEDKDGHSKVRRSGGCPFKNGRLQTPPAPEPVYQALANSPRHQHLAAYEHCYVLNHALDYRMAWDFDEAKQELRMAISAPTNGFVAFGFGMTFPGMNNTDIVLGYKDAQTGADCIRSMFVDDVYVGAPTDNSAMTLSQTSIHDDPITHRRTVAFTRPFHTGHHDIPVEYNIPFFVMWATSAPSASPPLTCTTPLGPSYHGPNRGHLTIDFKEPATIFASQNKC